MIENIYDIEGNKLDIEDDVVFSLYKGNGSLYKGKIIKITKRLIVIKTKSGWKRVIKKIDVENKLLKYKNECNNNR